MGEPDREGQLYQKNVEPVFDYHRETFKYEEQYLNAMFGPYSTRDLPGEVEAGSNNMHCSNLHHRHYRFPLTDVCLTSSALILWHLHWQVCRIFQSTYYTARIVLTLKFPTSFACMRIMTTKR